MMLRSLTINSPVDDHDDHRLRRLLDERVAHAPFHARCPSVSEFTDTPSVYSHPFFSPRPMAFPEHDPNFSSNRSCATQNNWSFPQARNTYDRMDDPAASMLDMEDDSSVSMDFPDEDSDTHSPRNSDGEDDIPRMSLLGPKMRVHSKAPWEVDDDLDEANESDTSTDPVSALKKTFKFGASSSSTGRASDESSRSQSQGKASLELIAPHGVRSALGALTQQVSSPSTILISPGRSSPSPGRMKFSSPNSPIVYRTPSPAPPSPHDATHSPYSGNHVRQDSILDPPNLLVRLRSHTSTNSSPSYHREESLHPYANPDFAVNYVQTSSRDPIPHSAFETPGVTRSDSAATVTEGPASSSHMGRNALHPMPSSDTSDMTSIHREPRNRKRSSTLHGREISSPLPSRLPTDMTSPMPNSSPHPPPLPGAPNIPGWLERSASPTFALISLEEARAQRSRSATVNHGSTLPSSRLAHSSSDAEVEQDTASIVNSFDTGQSDNASSRARARSISAGTRAKQAFQSMVTNNPPKYERRDSEPSIQPVSGPAPPGKALKHKKSGFMKFFNKDKEAPPVPSLSETLSNYQIHQSAAKPPKSSLHRIPVPQLTPSLMEADPIDIRENLEDPAEASPTSTLHRYQNNPRRTPPLSINTHSPSWASPSPVNDGFLHARMGNKNWQSDSVPQSAPAHVTEFPALKLRPVSTIFSSHFRDHLALGERSPLLEADSGILSPDSAGTVGSPVTPALLPMVSVTPTSKGGGKDDAIRSVHVRGDADTIIKSLQEQIVTAKQAWQRQIWELEGQVRDLKAEVEELREAGTEKGPCDVCGRERRDETQEVASGIVNRPRARTGMSTRFGSALS
ncbi:hypothetical protein BDN71DRAFT_1438184 [Pleurotus eryngii]|uniref:Uncharacterized protein n=1 Tax=Pleurotus eryngii TaxID=5323 RepID=A0A9P6A9B7_PLEER|nr:hypothetical protein BDN71DRAFT_1438184 [Pleurotus eryngii]